MTMMDNRPPDAGPGPRPPVATPRSVGVALAFICGLSLGWLGASGCTSTTKKSQPDFSLVNQAWNTIQKEYVDRSGLDSKDLTYGAISGMVDALGDSGHSTFLTPDMVRELKNTERGEFKGVGIEIQMKNGHVVIVSPMDGSPAQKAGLQPGDIIVKVGDEDVSDWSLGKVVERISGRAGTKVQLTIQEAKSTHTRQVTLVRASIKLHEVTWQKIPGSSVAHVRLASFDAGVTRDLQNVLAEVQRQGVKGIVLDLRNNPGGLLDEAVGVASQFIGSGNVLQAKDAEGKLEDIPIEKGGTTTNTPMVVLVNEGSASAAEIVAGALQDHQRAKLVGDTTFGTGTVLQQFRLKDGSALLLAVEEWLTPNGRSFWHKGLTPDFVVPLPPDVNPLLPPAERTLTPADLQRSDDRQLLTGLRLLSPDKDVSRANVLRQ